MCERLYIAAMLVTHLWPHTVHLNGIAFSIQLTVLFQFFKMSIK